MDNMDSNPIHHPSPAKKMKCSFLDYIQLLMISQAGWWTQTPSATPLQPKKWNAHFWIMFNFWWLAELVDGLKPHLPPLSSQKMKCSFLDYVQFLMIGRAGWWTRTPSATHLQPKIWNACFLDYVPKNICIRYLPTHRHRVWLYDKNLIYIGFMIIMI